MLPKSTLGPRGTRDGGQRLRGGGLRPDETLGRYPHQLSGGQRQRIMVARALMLKPKIIIADEPVSMVDASLRATILESLRELNQVHGISILYITHDPPTAYQIADNIVVLYQGRVAESGDIEHVIHDPQHPYTQLLVDSIPQPNPKTRWGEPTAVLQSRAAPPATGCNFYDRCGVALDSCTAARPSLYRTDQHRVTALLPLRRSAGGRRHRSEQGVPAAAGIRIWEAKMKVTELKTSIGNLLPNPVSALRLTLDVYGRANDARMARAIERLDERVRPPAPAADNAIIMQKMAVGAEQKNGGGGVHQIILVTCWAGTSKRFQSSHIPLHDLRTVLFPALMRLRRRR